MKLFLFVALALVGLAAAVPAELVITNTEERQDETSVGLVAELPTELDITNTEEGQDETAVSSDRSGLLVRRQFFDPGQANTVHIVNYTWRGFDSTRITRWQVLRVGADQGATATRTDGGVNTNFLSVRLESARGAGFNLILEIYGVS